MTKVSHCIILTDQHLLLKKAAVPRRWLIISGMFLLCILLAAGCAAGAPRTPAVEVPSVPPSPTVAVAPATVVPASLPPAASPSLPTEAPNLQPSPTLVCDDSLRFISDLTVPDGEIVARGARIDKRWQVENNGSCNWDERYRLKMISGADLGGQVEQALYPARSGALAVIRVMFVAPSKPGVYRSAWQAVSPVGDVFGDIIYIEIRVN